MEPATVVPAFDPSDDGSAGFGSGSEPVAVHQLSFQGSEEAFGWGIIETCPGGAHRGGHRQLLAQVPELSGSVLTASVAEWNTTPSTPPRVATAISNAVETSGVRR